MKDLRFRFFRAVTLILISIVACVVAFQLYNNVWQHYVMFIFAGIFIVCACVLAVLAVSYAIEWHKSATTVQLSKVDCDDCQNQRDNNNCIEMHDKYCGDCCQGQEKQQAEQPNNIAKDSNNLCEESYECKEQSSATNNFNSQQSTVLKKDNTEQPVTSVGINNNPNDAE